MRGRTFVFGALLAATVAAGCSGTPEGDGPSGVDDSAGSGGGSTLDQGVSAGGSTAGASTSSAPRQRRHGRQ